MTPSLGFLGQPAWGDQALAAFLERAARDADIDSLTVVVAWARYRGLIRVRAAIEELRARGGTTRLIVGIDEGGATRPGLLLALQLFDEAHVFHDPGGGTFHPKIYLAEGPGKVLLAVGSSNATPGGLFSNYEASLEASFTLPAEADEPALVGVHSYIRDLLAETATCLPLNEELVDRLVKSRRYSVAGHEQPSRRGRFASQARVDEADLDASGFTEESGDEARLFGARQGPRVNAPLLSAKATQELHSLELAPDDEAEQDPELPPPSDVTPPAGAATGATAVKQSSSARVSWTKVLPRGDAQQQLSSRTNVTGNVRLTQAKHDIDWTTWFREDLFGSAAWRPDTDIKGSPIERADIPFQVTIDGLGLGTIELEVTHAPHRESGQSNHTTVLRWGPLMGTMRGTDYTGYTLTLAQLPGGSFELDISP